MIDPDRVPGTRSDPEFTSVRTPPWEEPFTCRVRLPDGLPGFSEFLTAKWWSDRSSELQALGAGVERVADGWLVSTDHGPESEMPEMTVVVAPALPQLLDQVWHASGTADFQSWVAQTLLGKPDLGSGAWRYDLVLEQGIAGTESGRTESREMFVWPGDPQTLTVTELLSAPHLPELADRPDCSGLPASMLPLARELWAQVEKADAIYRLSLVHRAHDAVAILRRGTDPAVTSRLSTTTGDELREVSKRLRASVVHAGWRLTGYADALLWPMTAPTGDEVPMDFVCDVALDLLRRAQVVALPPAPDLAEWGRRLVELDTLRAARGTS